MKHTHTHIYIVEILRCILFLVLFLLFFFILYIPFWALSPPYMFCSHFRNIHELQIKSYIRLLHCIICVRYRYRYYLISFHQTVNLYTLMYVCLVFCIHLNFGSSTSSSPGKHWKFELKMMGAFFEENYFLLMDMGSKGFLV